MKAGKNKKKKNQPQRIEFYKIQNDMFEDDI